MEAYQKQADIVGQLSNSINKIFDSAIAKRNVLFFDSVAPRNVSWTIVDVTIYLSKRYGNKVPTIIWELIIQL